MVTGGRSLTGQRSMSGHELPCDAVNRPAFPQTRLRLATCGVWTIR